MPSSGGRCARVLFSVLRYFVNQPLFLEIAFKCSFSHASGSKELQPKQAVWTLSVHRPVQKIPCVEHVKQISKSSVVPCKLKEIFLEVGTILLLLLFHLLKLSEHDDNKFFASLKSWKPQLKACSSFIAYGYREGKESRVRQIGVGEEHLFLEGT